MQNGEWRMENGEWRMENAKSCLWTVFDENFFGAYIDTKLDIL